MAKVEDCPGFETFGADVKAAREAKRLARKTLAEMAAGSAGTGPARPPPAGCPRSPLRNRRSILRPRRSSCRT